MSHFHRHSGKYWTGIAGIVVILAIAVIKMSISTGAYCEKVETNSDINAEQKEQIKLVQKDISSIQVNVGEVATKLDGMEKAQTKLFFRLEKYLDKNDK